MRFCLWQTCSERGIKEKSNLLGISLLISTILIYLTVYRLTTIPKTMECISLYQRPHENHRIKIKPFKHSFPFEELESNDFTKLVNLTNFSFTNVNESVCKEADVLLLVLVPSAPKNGKKREAIRKTWGYAAKDTKVLFMLGISSDEGVERAVQEESSIHKDIVQGNFIDAYTNMTYKAVMSLKYAIYYCPEASYILKADDDSFVNMPFLRNFLRHDVSPYGAENLFLCNDMSGSPALRDPTSKWYVPEQDFPDKFFPSYCSGWYAVFTPDICFKLYREAQKLKYLYIDDAFVYGIAGKKGGVKHVDFAYYTLAYRDLRLLWNGTYDDLPIMFGSPNMGPDLIYKAYDYFRDKPVKQSINKQLGNVD
ncbi:beta-1,3-galactosyltransferase 5-like isoform X2 [Anthonomus grandis grandis]|uniref:beta-1,3-galactosyltransferase 5-like isoform X2 n=1 Tax=Anthonomus grandis grandis TaxID=2921223 RepID=UPI002166AF75|nr:beta-1,3-galactosyltransferase 5-like isoform X2 [Anthonomus grandis grandis]